MDDRRLLIVEDDPGLQKQMRWCIADATVFLAGNAREAEQILRKEGPQVVTLDLGLPPDPGGISQGLKCLELIKSLLPRTKVIVITGREERATALEAIERGADDFYQKPVEAAILKFVVDRAFRIAELEAAAERRSDNDALFPLQGFITSDPRLLDICRTVERIAPTEVAVTILGETGTGKEIVARNIHELSQRCKGAFVAINCAAVPEHLLETEFFGHEKGAFTGATYRKKGKLEVADGGTVFLDEVVDMPLPLQAKMLRFLQERTFERVGGTEPISANVRVVAATHNDLPAMIGSGAFREDLYYRLAELTIELPPLRERGDDALLLATHFLRQSGGGLKLSADAKAAIARHRWSGNVRELQNRIKRAATLCDGPRVEPKDLDLDGAPGDDLPLNLKTVRADAEREAIQKALLRSGGNVSQASRLLGVSRPTLYNLFEKYDIDHEQLT